MSKPLTYIAGPISRGSLKHNISQANAAALYLVKADFAVIVPHASCFYGNQWIGQAIFPEVLPSDTTHDDWYSLDLVIVRRCDAVLRLPGPSVGADLEVTEARQHNIPVFFDINDLIRAFKRRV